ncbi:MAG TPA: hypothetical protein GYA08_16640 [Chloroflexi bacterium]|nr:hypothetical protein [Chloroflexota bacterium]
MSYTHVPPPAIVLGVALGLFLWLCLTPVAYAADIIVNSTEDNTIAGDGLCTLREAVNNANANADTTAGDCRAGALLPADQIIIPAGVYTLTPGLDNTNAHGDLDIRTAGGNLELVGAGALSTTISGPGYVVGTDRILHTGVDGPGAVIVEVHNLTLRDGHAPQGGGAIYINGTYVLIEESVIEECEAIYAGGMSNNGNGGAIYMSGGDLTILNSVLVNNTARASVIGDVKGGAIHATNGANVLIEESILQENHAVVPDIGSDRTSAGAIFFNGGNLTLRRSQIISNSVGATFSDNRGFGGAIYFAGVALQIVASTVADNTAGEAAGALYLDGARAEIVRSTFSGNRAPQGYGGAIVNWSVLTITNSTFSGNLAKLTAAGVANNSAGVLSLLNSTFTDNACAIEGGIAGGACGVYNWGAAATVQNSILAGNRDLGSGRPLSPDAGGSFTSLGHNVVGVAADGFIDGVNGDKVGTLSSPLDARLFGLGANGGPTATHLPAWDSPVISAADAAACPPNDQRGVTRPAGAGCDVGAVEMGAPHFLPYLQRE